jgi:hypothetical protein
MNNFVTMLLAGFINGNPFQSMDGIFVFLYLGPETIMPLASILATVIGVILVFWRFIVAFIKKGFRFIFRRKSVSEESDIESGPDAVKEDVGGV